LSEAPKCQHCGKEKAVGFVRTESPTKTYHRDFRLCMPDIIDFERWILHETNAKGQIPVLVFMSPEDAETWKGDTFHAIKEVKEK
jgi:hypothetical protein